jgi:hypothetical protein
MATVSVTVKILSGDLFSLDVPKEVTSEQLDELVYDALPEDIRPGESYQMALLRVRREQVESKDDEDEYEEVVPDDTRMEVEEGECFYVSLMVDDYRLEMCMGRFIDARNPIGGQQDVFVCHTVYIYNNNVMIHEESVYYSFNNTQPEHLRVWYGEEKVESEWVGQENGGMTIHIAEDTPVYETIGAFAKKMASGCPNKESVKGIVPSLSKRLQHYMEMEFLREWIELWGADEEDYGYDAHQP